MTHNGIPVNWRPSNLVPKPRALPASCPLSADTLSGLPPAHPHIMQLECHWDALDMTLAHWIMDAHMPVKYTLNWVCTSMLVSGVWFQGNSWRLTSPLQTPQLLIHIVQVKHFDDPAYHIPWRDQHSTQDSFFSCLALFPQEVSSLLWHPFPHEFHLVSRICFQGSSHSEIHLEILGLYRPPPPTISHPNAALDFIQQLTIPVVSARSCSPTTWPMSSVSVAGEGSQAISYPAQALSLIFLSLLPLTISAVTVPGTPASILPLWLAYSFQHGPPFLTVVS